MDAAHFALKDAMWLPCEDLGWVVRVDVHSETYTPHAQRRYRSIGSSCAVTPQTAQRFARAGTYGSTANRGASGENNPTHMRQTLLIRTEKKKGSRPLYEGGLLVALKILE